MDSFGLLLHTIIDILWSLISVDTYPSIILWVSTWWADALMLLMTQRTCEKQASKKHLLLFSCCDIFERCNVTISFLLKHIIEIWPLINLVRRQKFQDDHYSCNPLILCGHFYWGIFGPWCFPCVMYYWPHMEEECEKKLHINSCIGL